MSGTVDIYGTAGSTCTMRVLMTGFEIGHPVNIIPVDMGKGEHKQPEHLARQPFGKVPAMQDGDFKLFESRAICRYLVDKYGDKTLIPTDIKEKAIFEQWASLEATTYTPDVTTILVDWFGHKFYGAPSNAAALKTAGESLIKNGHVLEAQLAKHDWVTGDKFSMVDIFLVTYMTYIVETPEISQWFTTYPHIKKWYDRTTARESFQKTLKLAHH